MAKTKQPTANKAIVVGKIPAQIKNQWVENIPTEEDMLEESEISAKATKGNTFVSFGFDVEELPHCCGVEVIGGFSTKISNAFGGAAALDSLIRNTLERFVSAHIEPSGRSRTIMFTTAAGSNESNARVAAAMANSPYFTMVKKFTNSNSGRAISVFISNQ